MDKFMSQKEVKRAQVLDRLKEGKISQQQASQQLGITPRQVRRLAKRYQQEGMTGLISKKRGRTSNRRLDEATCAAAIGLIGTHYRDFGPTLACEKLAELHGMQLSVESTRQLMITAGYWKAKRGGTVCAHPMRERRARFGELIQIDGSPHDWFEGRGEYCTLLVFIDTNPTYKTTIAHRGAKMRPTRNTGNVMEDIKQYMQGIGQAARAASRVMAQADTATKNRALTEIAAVLQNQSAQLLAANAKDVAAARSSGLDAASVDRLTLSEKSVCTMAEGLLQIAQLPDLIGAISDLSYRPSGIQVGKMRVPLGVIGIIYESRPNVTADAAGLCLKSGNAAILRGGSEAIHSNQAIAACVHAGLRAAGLPVTAVQVIATTDRAAVGELITMKDYVDVIVPRGGKSLIARISDEAKVPVIKHLDGICHVYIDDEADLDKAIRIADNAKTQRYGVCNTMETLLVAQGIAAKVLPGLCKIYLEKNVELRGDDAARALVPQMKVATEEDWRTEYLAPILSVRVVAGLDAAIEHINTYSSQHTDSIVTENYSKAMRFLREVDSSSVMVNASTRFADGFEYGLGAEIGISTDKIHARGPVGLEGLTSQKYIVLGSGQVRV